MGRLAATVGVLVVCLALAGGAEARAAPRCHTSGLVVSVSSEPGGGAAGSFFVQVRFTNFSGHVCALTGYPGVSAVSLSGRVLGTPAARIPTFAAPPTVTLARGATAMALLQIANVGVYPRASCRPTTAAGLRVYPPDDTASRIAPFPFLACARAGPAYLHVHPVARSA
jgi:hypothetical protein